MKERATKEFQAKQAKRDKETAAAEQKARDKEANSLAKREKEAARLSIEREKEATLARRNGIKNLGFQLKKKGSWLSQSRSKETKKLQLKLSERKKQKL